MDYRTIVSAEALQGNLTNPGLVIFDCRHELMRPEAGALCATDVIVFAEGWATEPYLHSGRLQIVRATSKSDAPPILPGCNPTLVVAREVWGRWTP